MSARRRHGREGKGRQKYDSRGSQGSSSQRGSQATGAGTNRSGLWARLVTGRGSLHDMRLLGGVTVPLDQLIITDSLVAMTH